MELESYGTTSETSRRERGRMLRSATLLSMSLATVAILVTGAIWTDTESVGANQFTTGTVNISTVPSSALVSFTSPVMKPGDSVVDDIAVSNSGTLNLRYAVKSSMTAGTAVLAAQLDMTIWDEAEEADGGTTCNAAAPATVLYGPADLASAGGINAVGDPATGDDPGDRDLAASTSEVLCFKVVLPSASDNTYQGLTTTATFDFAAEQA